VNRGRELDPQWIAGHLLEVSSATERATASVRDHLQRGPGYVAWSGGKDSTAALHIVLQQAPNIPVCWFDSGFEFPETRAFIHDVAEAWNVNLHIMTCRPSALDMLEASGAWGAVGSTARVSRRQFHAALIERPAARAHRVHGRGEVLGLRAAESAARRRLLATTRGMYQRENGDNVCAPLWDWSDEMLAAYHGREGIPENRVYEKLRAVGAPPTQQRAGLVLDGHSLNLGRADYLRLGWPDLWRELTQRFPLLAVR